MAGDAQVASLLALLGERHLNALSAWPAAAGGSKEGASAVLLAVVDIVQVGFGWS